MSCVILARRGAVFAVYFVVLSHYSVGLPLFFTVFSAIRALHCTSAAWLHCFDISLHYYLSALSKCGKSVFLGWCS